MSVLCIDLINLARPNFHSTSDCCCKVVIADCLLLPDDDNLNPLVGVAHHGNEKVDEDHGGDQHVQAEDELEEVREVRWVTGSHVHVSVTEMKHQGRAPLSEDTYVLIPNREKKSFILTWTGNFQPEQKSCSLVSEECEISEDTLVVTVTLHSTLHTVIGMTHPPSQPTKLHRVTQPSCGAPLARFPDWRSCH